VLLAGVAIQSDLVVELAEMLTHRGASETAATLLQADAEGHKDVPLTIAERETILRALDDPPAGLEELRAVLLREHTARVRDGLR
jgi:hypothetical protein